MNSKKALVPTAVQEKFIQAVLSLKYVHLMFGGAIRGGKTVAALMVLWLVCKIWPGSRWAVVRKDLPTLKRNTLPAFNKFRPSGFVGEMNRSDWVAKCTNGSTILFFPESVQSDPGYNRWAGLEVNGFLCEEANELAPETLAKVMERAGTWVIRDGKQPPPLNWYTTNPDDGWVKRDFHDPYHNGTLSEGFYFQPATIKDNPHLPQSYLKSLERLKETNELAYRRFVLGDWRAMEHPEQLISLAWCHNALNVEPQTGTKRTGVDVAHSEKPNADDTVIAKIDGNVVFPLAYYHGIPTDKTAGYVASDIRKRGVDPEDAAIDTVGLGAGTWDTLNTLGHQCHAFVAGARAVEQEDTMFRFKNRRSQAWWNLREMLRKGELCFEEEDRRLFEELSTPRYRITGDKVIVVESKDDIKKRIGRSTDAADAVVMAFAPREIEEEIVIL